MPEVRRSGRRRGRGGAGGVRSPQLDFADLSVEFLMSKYRNVSLSSNPPSSDRVTIAPCMPSGSMNAEPSP